MSKIKEKYLDTKITELYKKIEKLEKEREEVNTQLDYIALEIINIKRLQQEHHLKLKEKK